MFKIDKFRLVVVALLAVLTVAVAACESEPEKAPDPLIVGHLNALTGSLSYFGESHSNSIGLAADHINRAGGIQGGSVVLIHRDTAVNPVQGVSAAEELVNLQGVVAIVGALASGVTIPVATSVTVPNGVLQVSGASTATAITVLEDNDFLFRTSLSDASQGVVLADLAKELGYESAGILYINNAYGEGLAAQFTESFTALGGTVIASVPHEDSQPTFVSELEKATEGDPDVLIAISYQQAEIYLRQALEGGYADTFLFVDGTKIPESFAVIGKVYHCGGGIVYHRHDEKGLNWEPGGIRSGAGVRSSGVSQESTGSSDTWEAALCRLCLRR